MAPKAKPIAKPMAKPKAGPKGASFWERSMATCNALRKLAVKNDLSRTTGGRLQRLERDILSCKRSFNREIKATAAQTKANNELRLAQAKAQKAKEAFDDVYDYDSTQDTMDSDPGPYPLELDVDPSDDDDHQDRPPLRSKTRRGKVLKSESAPMPGASASASRSGAGSSSGAGSCSAGNSGGAGSNSGSGVRVISSSRYDVYDADTKTWHLRDDVD